jgi:penicillin-binding protein 1C
MCDVGRGLQPAPARQAPTQMSTIRTILRVARPHPYRCSAVTVAFITIVIAMWVRLGPIPGELLDVTDAASTVVVDRQGLPLYEALSGDGTRSIRLEANRLPPMLAAATVAAEDRRFYSHTGIDPIAIFRAVRRNIAEHQIVEGGSTITQQTAKLLLARKSPARSRGLAGKLQEAVLAQRLEHRFSKNEILALYLSLAAYGNQVVGAGRASYAYFGHDASMLTPAQAAFLAGLPQRPTGFNPYRNPKSALARQRAVLRRMQASGAITAEQSREAADERLVFTKLRTPFAARHFVERVLASVGTKRPDRIETTIDAGLQADVAGIISSQRAQLDRHGASNVAVVVLDNARGEWLAWEGSGDYFDSAHGGAIDGVVSPRQPGSALKPFTYALGFEEGLTPATVLADIPSHFATAEQGVLYSPRNYDGRYRGPLLARRALAGSENVPAVALASQLGVPNVLRFLLRAGFTTFDRNASYYGLGITLGNAEVRLDELVAAYSAFARGGEWIEPVWHRGPEAAQARERHPLVSPRTAYWIGDILSDPDAREYIFGRGGNLEFPFPVAVKTGTSQAYHDNWTVGYTRDVTVGVWVGNFDRTPLRDSTGVTGAGPIFHAVMLAAQRRAGATGNAFADAVVADPPEGLVEREICVLSGMPANPWCPAKGLERVPAAEDMAPCSWHHRSETGLVTIWPPEYRDWARKNGALTERVVNASTVVVREVRPAPGVRLALTISNPPAGATYLIDPTLRREFQTLSLRAVTERRVRLEWHVDASPVGSSSSESALEWPLAPGTHVIGVRDQDGRVAEAKIVVK